MKIQKYNESEILESLTAFPSWKFENEFLTKTFVFKDFIEAFGFMSRVALISEVLQHHPDWSNIYNKVILKLNTHDVHGISNLDFIFIEKVEKLLE